MRFLFGYGWMYLVDQSEHYYQLAQLGEQAFLRSAAPAALVRHRRQPLKSSLRGQTSDETMLGHTVDSLVEKATPAGNFEVYPLVKKPGAPFADMITVGRTPNNDVVIDDITVSRFHAFFQGKDGGWMLSDTGSKNGTVLDGQRLEPRVEMAISSGAPLKLGDVELVFYTTEELFELLSEET